MADPPNDKPKIKAPAPQLDPVRKVLKEVPPTTGERLTTLGDDAPINKTRAYFREDELIKLVRQHGKDVIWRKAMICPCITSETEQADLSCTECGGSGYLYVDPHRISALMVQFDKRTTLYERMGLWASGDVQVTVEPQFRLGFRDSLELIDPVIPMNEVLVKGSRRGRRRVLPTRRDSARYRIVTIAKLLFRCATTNTIKVLEERLHYTVSPEGWIAWTAEGDRYVPDGSRVSIHYDFHPVYLVDSWLHVTRDDMSGRKMPLGVRSRAISLPVSSKAKLMWLVDPNTTPVFDPLVRDPSGFGAKMPEP